MISQKFEFVKSKIRAALEKSGRDPSSITLIAVSKKQSLEKIDNLIKCNQLEFGENHLQEIIDKWPLNSENRKKVKLHFVGTIQSNKIDLIIEECDAIHSVDREKILKKIAHKLQQSKKKVELFVQVNVAEESQKAGVLPRNINEFIKLCSEDYGLSISGLMCMPPFNRNPEEFFVQTRKIADRHNLSNLSMGMSNDYETAIKCGSTHIRLGTALFGERIKD